MTRRVVAIGLALLVQVQLAAGRLAFLSPAARVTLAGITLLLVPGAALLRLLGARVPGGAALEPGWALGLGVAWNALLLSITALLGIPFTALLPVAPVATAALWGIAIARGRDRARAGGAGADASRAPLGGGALALTLLAAAGALLYAARFGGPLYSASDSPDHVGTLRRMLETGNLFPSDAFFRDAGAAGIDPRKFLWHGEAALIAKLSGAGPLLAWRDLPILLSPLFVLNAAALGLLLAGGAGATAAAWGLLLTYGSSLAATPLRESMFATKLADQLALATAVAVLADLARPSRGTRSAAVALAFGAVACHVFAAFQFALVFGAFGLALALRDRGASPAFRRVLGTALAIGAAALPLVLWQVLRTPPPRSIIHTEPQGLLTLWDGVRVVSPGVLWDWMGPAWLLFPWFAALLWRDGRANPAALFLLAAAAGIAAVLFLPPVVALLEPRLGYLLMRVVWITPLAGLIGWAVPRVVDQLRSGGARARRFAVVQLLVLALALAPAAADAVRVARHARDLAEDERLHSPLVWSAELAWLDAHVPAGSVVLSDPVTSYSVPMMTREHVVTLLDQHSSPSDPAALRRILDARDALDPFGDWAALRDVARRYGVDAVVLNRRFVEPPPADYWTPRPEWFAEERARLDGAGPALERLLDHGDFVVYRVHRDALDSLRAPPPRRPCVQPGAGGIARRVAPGTPGFLSLALSPAVAARGDTVRGVVIWRALEPLPAGSYQVAVRFDRPLPGGLEPPAFCAKPVRKLIERWHRERYRFRADHLPVGGSYGVDLWRTDEAVRDSFSLTVPRDVAPGDYQVRVRMIRQPHYPNFRLGDYFYDDDYYAGVPAGELRVRDGRVAEGGRDVRN